MPAIANKVPISVIKPGILSKPNMYPKAWAMKGSIRYEFDVTTGE